MGVEFQPTPNPNAGKFTVGRVMTDGGPRSFFSLDDAEEDPLARALLELPGVRSLFMVSDFVTVSKTPATDWNDLAPRVITVLEEQP